MWENKLEEKQERYIVLLKVGNAKWRVTFCMHELLPFFDDINPKNKWTF